MKPYLMICLFASLNFACSSRTKSGFDVFYVNSYHHGYPPSDEVEKQIRYKLSRDNIRLKVFYLDGKRTNIEAIEKQSAQIVSLIIHKTPDLVIVSDDLALQKVAIPTLDETSIPLVFCGINWSADAYHLPKARATGMIEILPVQKCIDEISLLTSKPTSITVISERTEAEEKNKAVLIPLFESLNLQVEYKTVATFDAWQTAYLEAQTPGSIVFLPTNGAIASWDNESAIEFVKAHTKVPSFTCDDFMMPYTVLGFTKVASEQGEFAADAALRILQGIDTSDIQWSANQRANCYVNTSLFARLKLSHDLPSLTACTKQNDYADKKSR